MISLTSTNSALACSKKYVSSLSAKHYMGSIKSRLISIHFIRQPQLKIGRDIFGFQSRPQSSTCIRPFGVNLSHCRLLSLSVSSPSSSAFQDLSNSTAQQRFSIVTKSSMSLPKVFVSRPDIPKEALAMLQDKCELILWTEARPVPRDFFLEKVKGVDAIFCMITDKVDKEILDAAGPQLKVIGTMSVGHDHVDVSALKAAGIKLGYTPNVLTDATAELTVAVLLAASRRLFEAHEELLNGGWVNCAWGPLWMCGQGLANSTVGIYGMGRIGQAVLERLVPFRPKTFLYSGRSKKPDVTNAEFVDFDTLLKQSDFVIVTCALSAETKEIFNARAFSLMKPNAVFVNSSRGGVVQQDDLIAALKANKIFAAGLDVMTPEPLPTDHELTKLKNCVVIPHVGSATVQSRTAMATLTARNILAGLEGTPLPEQIC